LSIPIFKTFQSQKSKLSLEKKAFIYDKENNIVAEFDLIKNAMELTAIIADKKDVVEINRYKNELQKLKNFLMDKIDQYPEIAKEISNDLNIVSREINTVNSISPDEKQISKGQEFGGSTQCSTTKTCMKMPIEIGKSRKRNCTNGRNREDSDDNIQFKKHKNGKYQSEKFFVKI
jgi:hypothetical protein